MFWFEAIIMQMTNLSVYIAKHTAGFLVCCMVLDSQELIAVDHQTDD